MDEMHLIIGIVTLFLLTQGTVYAVQILHTPVEAGWTWASVATGTSMVAIGEMFILFILYHFDSLHPLSILLVSPGVLLLLGGPMAALQIYKKWRANHVSNKIKEERDFTR